MSIQPGPTMIPCRRCKARIRTMFASTTPSAMENATALQGERIASEI